MPDNSKSSPRHRPLGAESTVTRRSAMMMGGLVLPLASHSRAFAADERNDALDGVVEELIERAERTNDAFITGDMQEWVRRLGPIPADFTLMQPTGGPASRGFNPTPQRLNEMARYYRGGRAALEVAETYASPDLIVLAVIERQRALIGPLPDQDWSLRVTLVYRRRGDTWEMVHRHADPLVRKFSLERTAALARGE